MWWCVCVVVGGVGGGGRLLWLFSTTTSQSRTTAGWRSISIISTSRCTASGRVFLNGQTLAATASPLSTLRARCTMAKPPRPISSSSTYVPRM